MRAEQSTRHFPHLLFQFSL